MLDIGCGCGLIPLFLRGFFSDGSYTGLDISPRLVDWCERHLDGDHFRFTLADLASARYNPSGAHRAATFEFPFEDGAFDVILLKSVFTHLGPDEASRYLAEIGRMLADGGRALATFFVIDGRGTGGFDLPFGDDRFRFADREVPEEVCAFDESWLLAEIRRRGLSLVEPIHYGTWASGEGLSFQDVLVLARAAATDGRRG